ncbi:MAG TPA: chemotaxis protein CheW [Gaiellaceae bacterium]|nr:chemotaxis protein CheW [Gaiellaceae bacterium]
MRPEANPEAGRPEVDWEQARARLERARRAVEEPPAPSPEEARRILESRAAALARPAAEAAAPGERRALVVFARGGERYGVDVARAVEALPLTELTPLPSAPSSILGVVNLRGRVLPVVDFRALAEPREREGPGGGGLVVVVEAGGQSFGLVADALEGLAHVEPGELGRVPAAPGEHPFVREVTGDLVGVLDLDAVAAHPRFVVDEEAL